SFRQVVRSLRQQVRSFRQWARALHQRARSFRQWARALHQRTAWLPRLRPASRPHPTRDLTRRQSLRRSGQRRRSGQLAAARRALQT
ncbi:MAG TPA: hypothetical protein VF897_17700, partial [Roseiflexaceae bacterium]